MEISDIKQDFNVSKMCRTCLVETDDEMQEIFGETATDSEVLSILNIFLSTNILISPNDGLPDKICKECSERVYLFYNFKVTIEQNDATLRNILLKNHTPMSTAADEKRDENFENDILLGVKTEIAFVDADPIVNPFIEDDVECDYDETIEDYANSTNISMQEDSINNNTPEIASDIIDESEDETQSDDAESETKAAPIEKTRAKDNSPKITENIDYVKDEEGKFVCKICNKKLVDKKGFVLHHRLHSGENLKRCHICGRGFIKTDHLKRHLRIHEKSLYCEHCGLNFDSRSEYKIHLKEEHEEDLIVDSVDDKQIKSFKRSNYFVCLCKICDKKFQKISTLRSHLEQHITLATFDEDLEIRNRVFLFNPLEIDLEKSDNHELLQYLRNRMAMNENDKFYQITTKDGHELTLSDSESEDENDVILNDRIELESHDDTQMPKKFYPCSLCTKIFKKSRESVDHFRSDHMSELQNSIDKCNLCDKCFPNGYTLHKHLKSQCENKNKKLNCIVCNKKFMWLDSMARHLEHEHPGTEKIKMHTCEICGKAFTRSEHLERHRKTHYPSEKKFECPVCQKKFNRKDNLRSHMKIHKDNRDDEDKHLCIYCGRAFSNSSNLIVHMRRHTGEKPYRCDLCDKGFPRSSDLQCHRRTHTGEKPCLCTICGKGFSRSNKLVRHMRIHTGIRPYSCTYCDRAFTQSNDLTLHIRRHTGEKPYVCGVCGDRFIQGTALKQHQRIQGHFEGSLPSPFSNISVNNPSRFTNSNLVNRRYCPDQQQPQTQNVPLAIKPVIPRRRTVNNNAASSSGAQIVPSTTQQIVAPGSTVFLTQEITPNDILNIKSPSPGILHSDSPSITNSIPQQQINQQSVDIKPNIQNINLQQYNIVPNMEIATLFFNQNFNSQPNHQTN